MNELLFEIGCEELPTQAIDDALSYMHQTFCKLANEYCIAGDDLDVAVFATPRRLALSAQQLLSHAKTSQKELLGPPVKFAYEANQKPSKALDGFLRNNKIDIKDIQIKQTDKGEYIFALIEQGGEKCQDLLKTILEKMLQEMPFQKSMRWSNETVRFARPIQWLMANFTQQEKTHIVALRFGSIDACGHSRGHRFLDACPFSATTRQGYIQELKKRFVVVEKNERKKIILDQIRKKAALVKGHILYDPEFSDVSIDVALQERYFSGLLDEVVSLGEWPIAICGTFDSENLKLPREVILSSMRNHQRYFAICDSSQNLLPYFVTVMATKVEDESVVVRGNERVLRARLSDAQYFYQQDIKRPLDTRTDDLKTVLFHKNLGTSYQKIERILMLSMKIAKRLELIESNQLLPLEFYLQDDSIKKQGQSFGNQLGRSVALCKADLTTLLVNEFPELQGIMGFYYAQYCGENSSVADCIKDHYQPKSTSDSLPRSPISAIVAIADRLDTIVGMLGTGYNLSGSKDPYALRRAALGIVRILLHQKWSLDIKDIINDAIDCLKNDAKINVQETHIKTLEFFKDRLMFYLISNQFQTQKETVQAVIKARIDNLNDVCNRLTAVTQILQKESFIELSATLKRVSNILKEKINITIDIKLFQSESETALFEEIKNQNEIKKTLLKNPTSENYLKVFESLTQLKPKVDDFFEKVMVMDKNESIKKNRLALLQSVVELSEDIVDWG